MAFYILAEFDNHLKKEIFFVIEDLVKNLKRHMAKRESR